MTGDSQRQDDDFLDDDFIIEDIAGKNDDLDQLFTTPTAKKPGQPTPAPEAEADADDLLFTDHTQGLNPSEKFQGGPPFGEANKTQWSGESLDLDEVGVPEETGKSPDRELEAAEQRFTSELGSLLKKEKEEEFALDSESELELVGQAPASDGISEIEQSGPFVLDDGEGNWQVDEEAQPTTAEGAEEASEVAAVGAEDGAEAAVAEVDEVGLQEAAQEAPVEPGWEPLPAASMDQLSEVGEVSRVDGEAPAEADAAVEAAATPAELAAVEGHDVYAAEEPAPVLVGPRKATGRGGSVLRALVAATLLFGTGAAVVLRPQWFGLSVDPERVQQARIERPKVDVAVPTPTVAAAKPNPSPVQKPAGNDPGEASPKPVPPVAVATDPKAGEPQATDPKPEVPKPGDPLVVEPKAGDPPVAPAGTPVAEPAKEPAPVAVTTEPTPARPAANEPGSTPPTATETSPVAVAQPVVEAPKVATETNPASNPVAVAPPTPVGTPVVAPTSPNPPVVAAPKTAEGWPVAKAGDDPVANQPKPTRLVRVGDDLMVGDVSEAKRTGGVVDGVLPGSRAFAQLHNGNYFIGAVKCVSAQAITLRIGEGEVTLPTAEVARLTELGSSDYEALQKATTGSVRLTNNNRLVGGILSHVADDHIVLEFRSNRVMLPRSAVGEVVQGEGESAVRLDVTREEDDWVKNLAERQLGTGAGPALIPDSVKAGEAAPGDGKTAAGGKPGEAPAPKVQAADPKPKATPKTQPATPPPGRQR